MKATKHHDELILSVLWSLPLDLFSKGVERLISSNHRGLSTIQKTYYFAVLLKCVLDGGNGMGFTLKDGQQALGYVMLTSNGRLLFCDAW